MKAEKEKGDFAKDGEGKLVRPRENQRRTRTKGKDTCNK